MANTYPRLFVTVPGKRRYRPRPSSGLGTKLVGFIVLTMLVGSAIGKIYLDRQSIKMGTTWQELHDKLTALEKEAENLRIDQERLMSGDHILGEARKFDLRPSEPGQVRIINAGVASQDSAIVALRSQ